MGYALTRSDIEIERDVEQHLRWDARIDDHLVDVSVDDGVVTLKGTVDSVKTRRAAAETARNTAGVHRVNNLLDVEPADPKPSDEAVASTA